MPSLVRRNIGECKGNAGECRNEVYLHPDTTTDNFLGPNCLKVILCITPLVFLVLVNAGSDLGYHKEYRQLASMLSFQIIITIRIFSMEWRCWTLY